MKIDPYLSPSTELKFKQIKDFLYKRSGTSNLMEEEVRYRLDIIGPRKDVLNRTLIMQALRPTNGTSYS